MPDIYSKLHLNDNPNLLTSLANRLIKICAKPDIASFSKELMSLFESEVNSWVKLASFRDMDFIIITWLYLG